MNTETFEVTAELDAPVQEMLDAVGRDEVEELLNENLNGQVEELIWQLYKREA